MYERLPEFKANKDAENTNYKAYLKYVAFKK